MTSTTSWWGRQDKSQILKWTVYSLLILNTFFYTWEEAYIASHTLRLGGSFFEWTEAFATTIDNLAWFGLLFMFELETYVLEDDAFEKRWVNWSVHGVRLVCYVLLFHTVVARYNGLDNALSAPLAENLSTPCALADQEISWGYNFEYTLITSENCDRFSDDTRFYYLEPTVITDAEGWDLEKRQTIVDMSDVLVWLLVIWAIELSIWLQGRNITGGPLMIASHSAKIFYLALFGHAAWWVYTGHWVYAWDQSLWILGFWAIESNLSEWRNWIRETAAMIPGVSDSTDS